MSSAPPAPRAQVCGTLRHIQGYESAFGAAGLGMALALAMLVVSHRLQLYAPAAALDASLTSTSPHENLCPPRGSASAAVGRQQPLRTRTSVGTPSLDSLAEHKH